MSIPTQNPLVQKIDFPNISVPDAEKDGEDFGKKIGKAIQYEWFRRDGNTYKYYDQKVEYHNRRLYARGEQSILKYKTQLAVNGDYSKLNLDWTPVPIVPKFVDIIVSGMNERMFTPKVMAIDAAASEDRTNYQYAVESDMIAKDFLMQTQEQFGIDAFNMDPNEIPGNDQELELHMQMKFKPRIELAEEVALMNILEMNDYFDIKSRVTKDIVELGIGIMKHEYVPSEGIRVKYVDPEDVIYSYSEDPFFDDVFYWGEVVRVPLTELKKIKPGITATELTEIARVGKEWDNEYSSIRSYHNDAFRNEVVNVLFYSYKTDKNFIYKKKNLENGGSRMIRRDETFNVDEENEMFSRLEKRIDVWYEGAYILGTDIMLKWEMQKNMVRPDASFQKCHSNYIAVSPKMYKGHTESMVSRMIQFADLIQVTHLKFQQVLQKMVPDGIYIDADGLSGIDLGNGGEYNPQKAVEMYLTTGSVVGRSYTEDGEYNHGKIPIQPLINNSGLSKLSALAETYNHYMNMIRDVTGLNSASDASQPDPRSLVGVQKLAALNSNQATRHILDATLFLTRRLCECLSLRISDVLEYADDREEFASQIGKYNVDILEKIKDLPLHYFGIYLEVSPDEEERSQLEAEIQLALTNQTIELEDAIDIRNIPIIKMANEMLKLRRRKRKEEAQADEMQKIQAQEESNIRSTQAAAQSKMQQVGAERDAKIAVEEAKVQAEITKLEREAELKLQLMEKEFSFNMQKQEAMERAKGQYDQMKEDRKDQRIDKQSTQQSQMIDQRQKAKPPKNFESSEDTLDGFGLEQFG